MRGRCRSSGSAWRPHTLGEEGVRVRVDDTDALAARETLRSEVLDDKLAVRSVRVRREDEERAGEGQTAAEDVVEGGDTRRCNDSHG